MKLIPSDKLFFGKYLYKITLLKPKFLFRISDAMVSYSNTWNKPMIVDPEWYELYDYISQLLELEGRKRIEGGRFSVFTNQLDTINHLHTKYNKLVDGVYGPSNQEEIEYLQQNRRKVLCDHYPKNRYHYKINLRSSTAYELRNNFLNWINNSEHIGTKVLFSNETIRWLKNPVWCNGPFMYVEDSSILSTVILYLGTNIKTIEEYILRSSLTKAAVNTESTVETANASAEPTT